jgi:hypothetical protein
MDPTHPRGRSEPSPIARPPISTSIETSFSIRVIGGYEGAIPRHMAGALRVQPTRPFLPKAVNLIGLGCYDSGSETW